MQQARLYAHDWWSVLVMLQAMDAAGKDGMVKHVTSGLNPQGCDVYSFKAPSAEELDHSYLWRIMRVSPARGKITIFNRSHYEEVLVVKVHPEYLRKQKLPEPLVTKKIWEERYDDINTFERHLARNGTIILKFFLHVSKEEQKNRFLERLQNPDKHWKFSAQDLNERQFWGDYMRAYERGVDGGEHEVGTVVRDPVRHQGGRAGVGVQHFDAGHRRFESGLSVGHQRGKAGTRGGAEAAGGGVSYSPKLSSTAFDRTPPATMTTSTLPRLAKVRGSSIVTWSRPTNWDCAPANKGATVSFPRRTWTFVDPRTPVA